MIYFEIIKKIVNRIKYKKFNSYNEALAYSENKIRDAYNSAKLCEIDFPRLMNI